MVEQAREWETPIEYLINTHAHWDHFLDNAALLRLTKARFGIHRESAPLLDDAANQNVRPRHRGRADEARLFS